MPDEIPYKKIERVEIKSVKHKNDGFEIELSRKC
jgi:hypothetical protein